MCHDKFIILANIVNDLLLGILTKSIEPILLEESTTTLFGLIDVGLIILTIVGVPTSYLVIGAFSGIIILQETPLASTCLISVQGVKSTFPVIPVQF
jgi:hypothetical protein